MYMYMSRASPGIRVPWTALGAADFWHSCLTTVVWPPSRPPAMPTYLPIQLFLVLAVPFVLAAVPLVLGAVALSMT